MKNMALVPIESSFIDTRNDEDELLDSCFHATIILIDLCNSTKLKQDSIFPKWVFLLKDFFDTITRVFNEKKIFPIKYLGDAILFMIPDQQDCRTNKYLQANEKIMPPITLKKVLETCVEVRDNWWLKNKKYTQHEETYKNFSSITISIDYGLVIDINQLNEGVNNDPLGTPVDRCFRISKYAGKNHIVCSNEFIKALRNEERDYCEECFISMNIDPPKGFDELTNVYVHKPSDDEQRWILTYEYDKLVDGSDKPLNRKMQTHLLLQEVNKLKRGK